MTPPPARAAATTSRSAIASDQGVKHAYRAYGLSLSSNVPLPWFSTARPVREPDVSIQLGRLPARFSLRRLLQQKPWRIAHNPYLPDADWLTVWQDSENDYFCFRWSNGATFLVNRCGSGVWAIWPKRISIGEILAYLAGNMMSFVLRLHGYVCLHACAVAVDGRAVLLGGCQGAGKSTLAAAFAACGYAVLDDDVAALKADGDQILVYPGYPRIGLWPRSVEALLGPGKNLPRVLPHEEKVYLPLGRGRYKFSSTPMPLGAVYIMGDRVANGSSPRFDAAGGASAIVALLANNYGVLPPGGETRAAEFRLIARAAQLPVRQVHRWPDLARVGELCEAILANFRTLRRGKAHPAGPSASAGERGLEAG